MDEGVVETAVAAAAEQEPEAGLTTVAALRSRLDELEALHVERALKEGWSWRRIAERLGVSKQAVHKKHARRIAEKLAAEDQAERRQLIVTGRARRSVRFAREEAAALDARSLRPEHLLLGLLRDDNGPVVETLAESGVTLEAARRGLEVLPGSADDELPPAEGTLPVASSARAAMEESLREAVRRRDDHLGVEHLLLALIRDDDGRAACVVTGLGADLESVERRLDERLRSGD